MDRREKLALCAIGGLLAMISLAHYVTPTTAVLAHNIYQRLYYIPVLIAALWFGVRGGLLCAAVTLLTYTPHVVLQWEHHAAYRVNQLVEMPMFFVVGALTGALVDRERRLRRAAERTAHERDHALRELRGTFDKMRRADRLSALGTLAASLAHEVRNPLGTIVGAVEILGQEIPEGHPRREFVDILEREVDRLRSTATKYLDFARPPVPERREVDLPTLVDEVLSLVDKQARRQSVQVERAGDVTMPVVADPTQVRQALLNLVINGIQAMPEGGRLRVRLGARGDRVTVSVRDHGAGVDESDAAHVFEPFYTTKQGGTGLGLAVARQIADNHGGEITLEHPDGGGARLVLALPATETRHDG